MLNGFGKDKCMVTIDKITRQTYPNKIPSVEILIIRFLEYHTDDVYYMDVKPGCMFINRIRTIYCHVTN